MRFPRSLLAVVGAVLLLHGAGCGGKDTPVKVSGKVTLGGQPLANVRVSLIPDQGHGRPASGTTDSGGSFSVTTSQPDDGALPGRYKVTITPDDPSERARTKEIREELMNPKLDPARRKELNQMMAQPSSDKSGIPDQYRFADTTPFILDVPPKGKVEFDLKPSGT